MLVRLLYASRSVQPLTAEIVEAILQRSRKNNPVHGITGLLCHNADVFMQVLEGGRSAVNRLYATLAADPRHRELILLDYAEIQERRFAGWTMGQVNLHKLNPSLLLKYAERPVLDPYEMSGTAASGLLDDLMATASIIARP